MSNINQYTFLQHNLKEKFKNDRQTKIEPKNPKGVVKINPTNLNNYQQILKNEQNSYRNLDYDSNNNKNTPLINPLNPIPNQINKLKDYLSNINPNQNINNNNNQINQITRINNLQQISKEKKDNQLKATIMKLRSNANEEKNMYNINMNIRQDRSADRVQDPPRSIITADMAAKKSRDLNKSVNLKLQGTRGVQMYSAQNRNNLILNNLYGENNTNTNNVITNVNKDKLLINKNNLNVNNNVNVKNNSIFNQENLNNLIGGRNHNNVYTPLNNGGNIRKNNSNLIVQKNANLNANEVEGRIFSPQNRRNIGSVSVNQIEITDGKRFYGVLL